MFDIIIGHDILLMINNKFQENIMDSLPSVKPAMIESSALQPQTIIIESSVEQSSCRNPVAIASDLQQAGELENRLKGEIKPLKERVSKLNDNLKNVTFWIFGLFALFIPQIIFAIEKAIIEGKLKTLDVRVLEAGNKIEALKKELVRAQAAVKALEAEKQANIKAAEKKDPLTKGPSTFVLPQPPTPIVPEPRAKKDDLELVVIGTKMPIRTITQPSLNLTLKVRAPSSAQQKELEDFPALPEHNENDIRLNNARQAAVKALEAEKQANIKAAKKKDPLTKGPSTFEFPQPPTPIVPEPRAKKDDLELVAIGTKMPIHTITQPSLNLTLKVRDPSSAQQKELEDFPALPEDNENDIRLNNARQVAREAYEALGRMLVDDEREESALKIQAIVRGDLERKGLKNKQAVDFANKQLLKVAFSAFKGKIRAIKAEEICQEGLRSKLQETMRDRKKQQLKKASRRRKNKLNKGSNLKTIPIQIPAAVNINMQQLGVKDLEMIQLTKKADDFFNKNLLKNGFNALKQNLQNNKALATRQQEELKLGVDKVFEGIYNSYATKIQAVCRGYLKRKTLKAKQLGVATYPKGSQEGGGSKLDSPIIKKIPVTGGRRPSFIDQADRLPGYLQPDFFKKAAAYDRAKQKYQDHAAFHLERKQKDFEREYTELKEQQTAARQIIRNLAKALVAQEELKVLRKAQEPGKVRKLLAGIQNLGRHLTKDNAKSAGRQFLGLGEQLFLNAMSDQDKLDFIDNGSNYQKMVVGGLHLAQQGYKLIRDQKSDSSTAGEGGGRVKTEVDELLENLANDPMNFADHYEHLARLAEGNGSQDLNAAGEGGGGAGK